MKCGEDVWISDGGNKEYHCQIEELREDEVLLIFFMHRNRNMNFQTRLSFSGTSKSR